MESEEFVDQFVRDCLFSANEGNSCSDAATATNLKQIASASAIVCSVSQTKGSVCVKTATITAGIVERLVICGAMMPHYSDLEQALNERGPRFLIGLQEAKPPQTHLWNDGALMRRFPVPSCFGS
jgi:hypothetical protein